MTVETEPDTTERILDVSEAAADGLSPGDRLALRDAENLSWKLAAVAAAALGALVLVRGIQALP